jgi:chromosomal replication initiation ATPase DnaA
MKVINDKIRETVKNERLRTLAKYGDKGRILADFVGFLQREGIKPDMWAVLNYLVNNEEEEFGTEIEKDTISALECVNYALGTSYNLKQLRGISRKQEIATVRQWVMLFLWKEYHYNLSEIGRFLGRNHATVRYAIDKLYKWVDLYPDVRNIRDDVRFCLMKKLKNKRKK